MTNVSYLRPPKPFSWSFSRLNNFETCPRKHFEVDIQKNYTEDDKEAVNRGHQFHDAMAQRLANRTPLPPAFAKYEKWASRAEQQAYALGATIEAELKLAITEQLEPCQFFDRSKQPWFRGVIDVLIVAGEFAAIMDWKTGKINEDKQQLAMQAQCVFAHYPRVKEVGTMYVWTEHDCTSTDKFRLSDMAQVWINLWPRIQVYEKAHHTHNYPPKPSGLCKRHCPVRSCEFHGRGSYQ